MSKSAKENLTFSTTDDIDANDLMNLVVNAFDGGATNYWAANAEVILPKDFDVHKIPWLRNPDEWANVQKTYIAPFVEGGKVILFDNEEEGKEYILDLKAIARGVKVMSSEYSDHWADFRQENDDACTADVFIQCCVMGEVVFG